MFDKMRMLMLLRRRSLLNPLTQLLLLQRAPQPPIVPSTVPKWSFPNLHAPTDLIRTSCPYHHLFRYSTAPFSSSSYRDGDDIADVKLEGDVWEDEEDENLFAEAQIGDGGDGGGVVLRGVGWGERALLVAEEVLRLHFSEEFEIFAFKTSPRGYIYIRLDKLSSRYGCPGLKEIETFSDHYKKQLDEDGAKGELPMDLALEVSSPGAERILKVPEDLGRFKDLPMRVQYIELNAESSICQQREGFFVLDSLDTETEQCVWKLSDVKENRDETAKGRPLSRKQRDWRLSLPFTSLKKVTLYLDMS